MSWAPILLYASEPYGELRTTFIAEKVKEQLGYDPAQFVSDAGFWKRHIHPDDAKQRADGTVTLFERGTDASEYRFVASDGSHRWPINQRRLIRNEEGVPVGIVGCLVDVTEPRRRAEEALLRGGGGQGLRERTSGPHQPGPRVLVVEDDVLHAEESLRPTSRRLASRSSARAPPERLSASSRR